MSRKTPRLNEYPNPVRVIETQIPDNARPIPGFNGDYLITPAGEVYSSKWRGPRLVETFGPPEAPRVCLWRHGHRWRPNVATLVERTFDDDEALDVDADELAGSIHEMYGDDPAVQSWLAENFNGYAAAG